MAANQDGVVARARLLASGVSRWAIDRARQPLPHHVGPPHPARPRHHFHHHALLRALAEAEFHHDTRPEDIKRTLRRGHSGSANLRAALDAHAPGHGQAKSQLERKFRRPLIKDGIPLPRRNQPIGPWQVDCLWPEQCLIVELDGRQHRRPHQADTDDDRDLWLRRHGYSIRRYGEKQITRQPAAVIEDVLAVLNCHGREASSV